MVCVSLKPCIELKVIFATRIGKDYFNDAFHYSKLYVSFMWHHNAKFKREISSILPPNQIWKHLWNFKWSSPCLVCGNRQMWLKLSDFPYATNAVAELCVKWILHVWFRVSSTPSLYTRWYWKLIVFVLHIDCFQRGANVQRT